MSKTEIMVHAWHVFESSGGFDWAPTSGPHGQHDVEALTNAHDESISIYGATSSTLCTLRIAGYDPNDKATWDCITDFIEGELQDAIEVGLVGHILGHFDLEGES